MISLARCRADSICSLVRLTSFEIDGAIIVGHVKRDRGHVEEANEGGGKDVLSRMLLHVVTATSGVDLAADMSARGEVFYGCFKVVDDATVFRVGHFGDAMLWHRRRDPSRVVDLASASRVEGGTVESDCWTRGFA